jgi:hypothetical protein
LIANNYVNNIRKLHGLPIKKIELPPENILKTQEEERIEKMNAELEEYLRIGEEIAKNK